MDILIQDSWLREYLETSATPRDIQRCLSLCGPSVERIERKDEETIYHIEVTTNRVTDSASVMGIAREAAAILPRFGFAAKLLNRKTSHRYDPAYKKSVNYLDVKIEHAELCPRFTAVLLKNVQIKPSSEKIVKRLERNGLRALNNIVDITNYLTIELGQPMHVFDYDEIKNHKMLLRESKDNEAVKTLDGMTRKIPTGSIVIEDGNARLIDLCGVMGGFLSHTKDMSRNILLFIQTYDPIRIRKTCQATAFRTDAAGLFEKWVDPEGIPNALGKTIKLIIQEANPEQICDVIDIYPNPIKSKTVICPLEKLYSYADEEIPGEDILQILNSLGIKSKIVGSEIISQIPSFRSHDIVIPEDIIEEIVRIYGYFNLKGKLPEGELPEMTSEGQAGVLSLQVEKKIKNLLKETGFTEVYTFSMVSENEVKSPNSPLEKAASATFDVVKIKNPLTQDWKYMRRSLYPSLQKVIDENLNFEKKLTIFEMANVYAWSSSSDLPMETQKLGIIATNHDFSEIKGKLEYVFEELGIKFKISVGVSHGEPLQIGNYGKVDFINNEIIYVELDVASLVYDYSDKKNFVPIPKFPEAYEDLSLIIHDQIYYSDIEQLIRTQSRLISRVEIIDEYDNSMTLRVTYQSEERNITNEDIKRGREKILSSLKQKLRIVLKM